MRLKFIIAIFFICLLNFQNSYGQYSISGYLKTEDSVKTVYLATLRFDEQRSQSESQIIASTKTDSTGYFEITGHLLSEKDKFYRIHSNINSGAFLELTLTPRNKNYLNFIFSNNDTIYFPENTSTIWFKNPVNTNLADKEWRSLQNFKNNLNEELSKTQNSDVAKETREIVLTKYKTFCKDSLSSPLINLLAYANIKMEVGKLYSDFKENPGFYHNILSDLKDEYGETSYYSQFKEEISLLSFQQVKDESKFHKNLNYILIGVILLMTIAWVTLFKSKKDLRFKLSKETEPRLTQQEEKIVQLIYKGKSNKEIADELFISLSTVKTHITSIYSKLKVSNRQQIINKLKNSTRD